MVIKASIQTAPRRLSGRQEVKNLRKLVSLAAHTWLGDNWFPRPLSYQMATHNRCSLLTTINHPRLIPVDSHLCPAIATMKKDSLEGFRILPDWSRMSMYNISAMPLISALLEGWELSEAELWIVTDTQYAGTRVNIIHRVHRKYTYINLRDQQNCSMCWSVH